MKKKAFIKRPLSALLTVIMMLSALPLLATGSSAALPGGLDSYITVNSDKIAALSKKATTDGLIKKLTDYNWYYCSGGMGSDWVCYYHIKSSKINECGYAGNDWTNREFSYQKKSGATIAFGEYSITDIGLDQALVLVYKSGNYTSVELLYKCDRKFYLNEYGDPTIYESELKQYKDYEKISFVSPRLSKLGISNIQIKNNGTVNFSPTKPSYTIFLPDLLKDDIGNNIHNPSAYSYIVETGKARNCCIIIVSIDDSYYTDNVIYLVKQENSYFAFLRNNYNHFILEEWTKWFLDVPSNAWYYNSVKYVYDKGIMSGYANGRFGSVDNLKRQDFVVILSKLAQADLSSYANTASKLKDVKKGAYYAAAVNWAVENNIIAGYANGNFGVGDNITREQIATILYRYTGSPTIKNPDKTLSKFKDGSLTSAFAKDAVAWAVLKNVISGKSDGRLAPTSFASRAEIATIIMNADKSNALVY